MLLTSLLKIGFNILENHKKITEIFEQLIYPQWTEIFKENFKHSTKSLEENVQKLWHTYTRISNKPKLNLLSQDRNVWAYYYGFHLNNSWRFLNLLEQSFSMYEKSLNDHKLRIWDLGSATGAVTHSLVQFLTANTKCQIQSATLVDTTKKSLAIGNKLLSQSVKTYTINCNLVDFTFRKTPEDTIDVFNISYVFNELYQNKRALKHLLSCLSYKIRNNEKTIINILDSAHQNHNKSLLNIRNQLAEIGFKVVYPCPKHLSCPAIDTPNRCFMNSQTQSPKILNDHLEKIDRNIEKFDFVGYVFASPNIYEQPQNPHSVIIGKPENSGHLLCKGDRISKKNLKIKTYFRGQFHYDK